MPVPSLTVLLIEDNRADAWLVQSLLATSDDITLRWVSGLDAALAELGSTNFDAVLLDPRLPDATGCDLLETIAAAAPAAAIVVSSGQAPDDGFLTRALIRKGAEDVLPKAGLTGELLARTITTAVERKRAAAGWRRQLEQAETALSEARIGHLSWPPGAREVAAVGALPGEAGGRKDGQRYPVRALLRRLTRRSRRTLCAALRELARGSDRLAVVLVEPWGGGPGLDLVVELAARRGPGGHILRVDMLVRDSAMIDRVERLEDDLITLLNHELRTPLTTICGALGLVVDAAQGKLAASTMALVESAIANAERIARVIGGTLEGGDADGHAGLRCPARRVPLGRSLGSALAGRLLAPPDAPRLRLTPASHAIEALVEGAPLRRAIDCLFAELATTGPVAGRYVIDVALAGDIAWLEIQPEGAIAGPAGGRPAAGGVAVLRSAPAVSRSGAQGWRIAVPLAA